MPGPFVLVESLVSGLHEVEAELGLGQTEVFVSRSCRRLPAFRPVGVSVVCPVVKRLVSPLALEDPRGNDEQIITMPPTDQLVERRAACESRTFVPGADTDRPNLLEWRSIIRTDVQEALRGIGLLGQQGIGAFSAPVGQPVARTSAASRYDDLRSCISRLLANQTSVAAWVAGLSEVGSTVFQKHVKRQPGMFAKGDHAVALDLQQVDVGNSGATSASEPSVAAIDAVIRRVVLQSLGRASDGDNVGVREQQFTFDIGFQVAKSKFLSMGASKLTTEAVCKYYRPGDDLRPGDPLPELDEMFDITGCRRALPSLAQLAGSMGEFCIRHPPSTIVAPGLPSHGARPVVTAQAPASSSTFVRHHWGLLRQAVQEGAATRVFARGSTREPRHDRLTRAMQSQRHISTAFGNIDEQEFLFRSIGCRSGLVSHSDAGEPPKEVWHSKSGASPGLLVDIGVVNPLAGTAFVKPQFDDMKKHGFQVVWKELATPEYVRGVGKGSQRCSRMVHLVGALHDGEPIGYSSPVLDEDLAGPDASCTPLLYSLAQ